MIGYYLKDIRISDGKFHRVFKTDTLIMTISGIEEKVLFLPVKYRRIR
ncbi:MAG: hypothetical protein WA839_05450 [Flavobacteriaceae bacterium]|tara:strand:+ start:6471 stop:6614 length:144 start_codon:yes stop_codon:yes gene_type:complete